MTSFPCHYWRRIPLHTYIIKPNSHIYIYIRFSVFRTADDHAERLLLFTSTRVTLWFERAMFTNVGRTSGLALILLLYYHIVIGFPDILPHYWRLLCHRYGTIDCIITGSVQVSFSHSIIIITIVLLICKSIFNDYIILLLY